MKLILAAVGRLGAGAEQDLFNRYFSRASALASSAGLASVNFREFSESHARTPEERRRSEAKSLAGAAGKNAFVCALDERGANKTSVLWAAEIARLRDEGRSAYALVIGGPDGLDPELRLGASTTVGFGAVTWPHRLVRVMAAEQIYRCLAILSRHPYHRG